MYDRPVDDDVGGEPERDADKVKVGDIITPAMRDAGVKAYINCPTRNIETKCVAIFISMMQALEVDDGD